MYRGALVSGFVNILVYFKKIKHFERLIDKLSRGIGFIYSPEMSIRPKFSGPRWWTNDAANFALFSLKIEPYPYFDIGSDEVYLVRDGWFLWFTSRQKY